MKYQVIFHFNHAPVTVVIEQASGPGEAERIARNRDQPPVPDSIAADVVAVKRGGKRKGAGPKAGSVRVAESRGIRKQIRWTEDEWQQIEQRADRLGVSVADYQRGRVLCDD